MFLFFPDVLVPFCGVDNGQMIVRSTKHTMPLCDSHFAEYTPYLCVCILPILALVCKCTRVKVLVCRIAFGVLYEKQFASIMKRFCQLN